MVESPRKRPRTTVDGVQASQLPSGATRRDDEFWFDDGNLIIIVGDVEFRVYRGPLVKHSPVFREMLTLPQPPTSEASEPGHVPVVHVPEHPTSFRHLLREFMAGGAFQSRTDEPAFEVVSAIIRLGHKYELDHIVKKGLDHLKRRYPDDYFRWSLKDCSFPRYPDDHLVPAKCISVVNIARLTDTPSLLRSAFFECCSMDPRELMKGYQREDGVCEQLSADDLTRVLLARTELVRLDALAAIRIFRGAPEDCDDPDGCGQCFHAALQELHDPLNPGRTFSPTLKNPTWTEYARTVDVCGGFCDACISAIRSAESSERLGMWQRLPSICDFPEPPRRLLSF